MGVEVVKDPRTRQEITTVSGIVEKVYINKLKEIKTFTGGKGGDWTPDKRIDIIVDKVRVSLGLSDKEGVRAKDIDGNYHDVVEGVEVNIEVNTGEYNGKPTYNARNSDILVLDVTNAKAPVAPSAGGSETKAPYKPKDMTGVEVGHSLNCAMSWLPADEQTSEKLLEVAEQFHLATNTLKKKQRLNKPDSSEYDNSASVGQAILASARLGSYFSTVEEVVANAEFLLENVVEQLTEIVKAQNADTVKKQTTERTTAKPAAKAPAKKATRPTSEYDLDDSAPF